MWTYIEFYIWTGKQELSLSDVIGWSIDYQIISWIHRQNLYIHRILYQNIVNTERITELPESNWRSIQLFTDVIETQNKWRIDLRNTINVINRIRLPM